MTIRETIELVAPNGANVRHIMANMIARHGCYLGTMTPQEFVSNVCIAAQQVEITGPAAAEAVALRFGR